MTGEQWIGQNVEQGIMPLFVRLNQQFPGGVEADNKISKPGWPVTEDYAISLLSYFRNVKQAASRHFIAKEHRVHVKYFHTTIKFFFRFASIIRKPASRST
jgi:hypothetical protein